MLVFLTTENLVAKEASWKEFHFRWIQGKFLEITAKKNESNHFFFLEN